MAEVRRAAITVFGMPNEETADSLSFLERDSAGDDGPSRWLIESMQAKAKQLRDQFANVFISSEVIDEWYHVVVHVKDHVRIDRPEWDNKKVMTFLKKTVAPELQPFYQKVVAEWEHYDGRPPRIKAFYGPKWNDFVELSLTLVGDTNAGWEVCARFGAVAITHKVTTSRGLLQAVWKKLKAEIGDLLNLDKVNKQGTW